MSTSIYFSLCLNNVLQVFGMRIWYNNVDLWSDIYIIYQVETELEKVCFCEIFC